MVFNMAFLLSVRAVPGFRGAGSGPAAMRRAARRAANSLWLIRGPGQFGRPVSFAMSVSFRFFDAIFARRLEPDPFFQIGAVDIGVKMH